MTTYKQAGVDMAMGNKCSRIMYEASIKTFENRKGRFGEPSSEMGGFTGPMYVTGLDDAFLVKNSDGIGTKAEITERLGKYDTIAFDLLAMVCDDAITTGAEPFAVTDTLNVRTNDVERTEQLAEGLVSAAQAARVAVVGGEIAELGDKLNCEYTWDADVIGVLERSKKLPKYDDIVPGDRIIGFKTRGFRCNGYSLVRKVLKDKFGDQWHQEPYDEKRSWGEIALIPSIIYTPLIVDAVGGYKETAKAEIKGITHITSDGIPGNLPRMLPKQLGAYITTEPLEPMLKLQEYGFIPDEEAYWVWNMGVGMLVVCNDDAIFDLADEHGIDTFIAGEVTASPNIVVQNKAYFCDEPELVFPPDDSHKV